MRPNTATNLLLLSISFVQTVFGDDAFRTLLYGEKLKGFLKVSPVGNDQYLVQFDIKESLVDGVTWSVHTSSAPYDLAVMTENCKRCKKSPHIIRKQELKDQTLSSTQLIGHTIVLETDDEVLACATVLLPSQPLLHASFHEDPVQGHIHIIPMKDKVRIMPDLKYIASYEAIDPREEIIDWAFVESCEKQNVLQNSDGTELGVDSRTTLTLDTSGVNVSLHNFELFRNGKPFACATLQNIEPRTLNGGNVKLMQSHFYSPVLSVSAPDEIHIRDDCMDLSTEAIHYKYEGYFPSMTIFGPDSMMLKSLVVEPTQCSILRPQFPRPAATATFSHPIAGRVVIVDTDDIVLLTGSLRHLYDDQATRATVQISPKWADASGCPQYLEQCTQCFTVQDAAVVVGRNDSDVTLSGVFPYFSLNEMRSVIIDLEWTKICANLTHLPNGAISSEASIKRYSPVSAPVVGTVVLLEYPANNYTEIILNKKTALSSVSMHSRPVDMTVTQGPPCGELTIGPKKNVTWLSKFAKALKGKENDTTIIVNDLLVTGNNNIMGNTLLVTQKKDVFCGYFEMSEEKTVAIAKFNHTFHGFVKLTQYGSNPSAGLPTEVSYVMAHGNATHSKEKETLEWSIVNAENMTCGGALIYNPTQSNSTLCSTSSPLFCPIGSTSEKTGELGLDKRIHITVPDVPLSGQFSVVGRSIRIKSSNSDAVECAPLVQLNEASFRWTVLSKSSLSQLQTDLSKRLNVDVFQIKIDYNRELTGARCSIYRVTVYETDDKLEKILSKFDVSEKRFKADQKVDCGGESTETTHAARVTASGSFYSISYLSIIFLAIYRLLQ